MVKDYADTQALASRLITKFGGDASLVEVTVAGGDVFDPSSGTTSETLHAMKAVEVEFSRQELDGGSVQTGDVKLMTTDPGLTPTTAMPVRWASRDYQVVRFDRIAPNGSDLIAYEWHLRP